MVAVKRRLERLIRLAQLREQSGIPVFARGFDQ
jgi:hypothetical protein